MNNKNNYIEKPSFPFSNGTEYEIFLYNYCEECKAFKLRGDMFPEFPEFGGCPILDKMEMARFDESLFPSNAVVEIIDAETNEVVCWHRCKNFKPIGETE